MPILCRASVETSWKSKGVSFSRKPLRLLCHVLRACMVLGERGGCVDDIRCPYEPIQCLCVFVYVCVYVVSVCVVTIQYLIFIHPSPPHLLPPSHLPPHLSLTVQLPGFPRFVAGVCPSRNAHINTTTQGKEKINIHRYIHTCINIHSYNNIHVSTSTYMYQHTQLHTCINIHI